MTNTPLYELTAIGRSFEEAGQTVIAIKDLTVAIPKQRFVAICGPSGSGKSSLLHILGLLDRGYWGQMQFLGEDPSRFSVRATTCHRLERIGFVFQRHHLIDAMTVLENVAWPNWRLYRDRRRAYARANDLLADFGLADRVRHHPAKLSGGELQRVALARALVNSPEVLLADEPTAQLDQVNASQIVTALGALCRKGHSVIAVTHDPIPVRRADIVLHMSYGQIIPPGEDNHEKAD